MLVAFVMNLQIDKAVPAIWAVSGKPPLWGGLEGPL